MRATLFGLAAITLAGIGSASALPLAGMTLSAPATAIEQVRVVSRTVVRGPRCRTVVTKRRGPYGRVTMVRTRRCF
ncbi:hypothetical protein ACYQR9_09365 [Methylobacterium sp. CM6241]